MSPRHGLNAPYTRAPIGWRCRNANRVSTPQRNGTTATEQSAAVRTGNVVGVTPTTGSLALYAPSTATDGQAALTEADMLIDFVQWGAGGQANEATAVAATFWTACSPVRRSL